MKNSYIPKNQRKKILLLCDDIRVHSGIAHMGRELVINTAHRYNWVNLGGAIKHPEQGQRFDLSEDTNKQAEITDSSVILYPTDGYGNPDIIRQLLQIEKPDAIFLITDPRYWVWLFQMENEIRKHCPIVYLNIWDDYPAPLYNETFYESCDAFLGISKQTVNINKLVLDKKLKNKIIKYVPHGVNHKNFRPLTNEEKSSNEFTEFKKQILGDKEYEFVLFFNSRNIRRKQIPDTILAYKYFIDSLSKEEAEKCLFLLHTQPVDENGTDLNAVIELLFENKNNIKFTNGMFDPIRMNWLYNMVDAQILLTSNEGWGLSLTEALVVGLPIIANVTGGMQDQMRFELEDGSWVDFDEEFPSNHRGTIRKHGEWAFPVYPTSRSIQGSVPTPYIFDDRCEAEDAAEQIKKVYSLGKEERKKLGNLGREWALGDEAGFTSEKMGNRIINALDELFDTWEPREKYELIKAGEYKKKVLKHKLIY